MDRIIYSFPYSSLCCACFSKSTQSLQSFKRPYKKRGNGCNFDVTFPITFSSCLPHVFPPSADLPGIQAYWFSAASLFFSYFHFYALSHLQLSGFVTFFCSEWFDIFVFCHFLYFGLAYRYHDLYLGVYLWFY